MRVLTGTSGFGYRAWKGRFYPPDLPAARMLAYYASRLPVVEVNATFRRLPTPEMLAGWSAQVPPAFVFALKAPQRITHVDRLAGTAGTVSALYRAAAELGPALGAILYQLPPTFRKDVPRLQEFLAMLPAGGRAAFEFRHPSWGSDDVYATLAAANAAWCATDTDEGSSPLVATASFGYLRLRRTGYQQQDLRAWVERVLAQPWGDALVFFKHEDDARGPAFALAVQEILGGQASTEARPPSHP